MDTHSAYNSWANTYDLVKNSTRDLDQIILQQKAHYFHSKIVLEAGCGTGKNTQWISKIARVLFAFDFSTNMLAKAQSKIQGQNINFVKADLLEWPFGKNCFEIITINLVLEHFKNLSNVFRSAYKSLQTPGLLLVNELHPQKQLDGCKAHFESHNGNKIKIISFFHSKEYFYVAGKHAGFDRIIMEDCCDHNLQEIPRILSLEFYKD